MGSLLASCSQCTQCLDCQQRWIECFDIDTDEAFDFGGQALSSPDNADRRFPEAPAGELMCSPADIQLQRLQAYVEHAKKGMRVDMVLDGVITACAYKCSQDLMYLTFVFAKNRGKNDIILSFRSLKTVTSYENPILYDTLRVPPGLAREQLLAFLDKDQKLVVKFPTERERDTCREAIDLIQSHG